MMLEILEMEFSICKIQDVSQVDFSEEFCFVMKTEEELSLVCRTEVVPKDFLACELGFRAIRIVGTLDFSLIGILSKISAVLAEALIGIFAISTYNTDYILMKNEKLEAGMVALKKAGYTLMSKGELV